MRPTFVLLCVICSIASGCTDLNRLAKTEQKIPITVFASTEKVGEAGAVYLWPPYSSAAIVDGKGNRCVLAASGAKTIDASSEAALKIGKALEKIEGLDASVKNTLLESFVKISAADAHAAFVDVALFHLCLLDQNGSFKELKELDDGRVINRKWTAELVKEAYLTTIGAGRDIK